VVRQVRRGLRERHPDLDGSRFEASEKLFATHDPGTAASRPITQLGMLLGGGRDGALYIMIGRKREARR
jgi:hypothetical protein